MRPPRPAALVAYGAAAGLIAAALGGLAASPLSGNAWVITWLAVTAVLSAVAVRLAEPVIAAVSALLRPGGRDEPGGGR